MSDIVERLRRPPFGTETSERNLMTAAADEIERLRALTAPQLHQHGGGVEEARAEQWRLRRDAEGSRDAARAAADSLRIERDALRSAVSDILEGWDFWDVNPHDREPPRAAISRARAALAQQPLSVQEPVAFQKGDRVEKATGYKWPGLVVAAFKTLSGADRYVVECTVPEVAGALHIYAPSQLAAAPTVGGEE